jgi:hypothetical protein
VPTCGSKKTTTAVRNVKGGTYTSDEVLEGIGLNKIAEGPVDSLHYGRKLFRRARERLSGISCAGCRSGSGGASKRHRARAGSAAACRGRARKERHCTAACWRTEAKAAVSTSPRADCSRAAMVEGEATGGGRDVACCAPWAYSSAAWLCMHPWVWGPIRPAIGMCVPVEKNKEKR